jgi:hypothetical protein
MSIGALELRYYLAEWYRPRLCAAEVEDARARLEAGVAAMCMGGLDVQLLLALAVPTDEVLFALFAASSEQEVDEACRRAGIPAERLTYVLGAVGAEFERINRATATTTSTPANVASSNDNPNSGPL